MAKNPQNSAEPQNQAASHSTYKTDKVINVQSQHRPWLYAVLAVMAVLFVFALGASLADHHRGMIYKSGNIRAGAGREFGLRMAGERFMSGGYGSSDSGQSRLSGVVTAVNGNNFTVAGNGSTTEVNTSSSTQYQNGNQVKQNDTVIVFGAASNGTITATNIVINP